jgi:hypothetical protein
MPKDGKVGQSFMEFHRYADGTMPAFGDRWLVGNDIESLNFIPSQVIFNMVFKQ